jgi:hypothetical protein
MLLVVVPILLLTLRVLRLLVWGWVIIMQFWLLVVTAHLLGVLLLLVLVASLGIVLRLIKWSCRFYIALSKKNTPQLEFLYLRCLMLMEEVLEQTV